MGINRLFQDMEQVIGVQAGMKNSQDVNLWLMEKLSTV